MSSFEDCNFYLLLRSEPVDKLQSYFFPKCNSRMLNMELCIGSALAARTKRCQGKFNNFSQTFDKKSQFWNDTRRTITVWKFKNFLPLFEFFFAFLQSWNISKIKIHSSWNCQNGSFLLWFKLTKIVKFPHCAYWRCNQRFRTLLPFFTFKHFY